MKFTPLTTAMKSLPVTTFLVTGLYFGRIKPASGTWGTLSVLPIAYAVSYFCGLPGLLALSVLLGISGTNLINRYLTAIKTKDPSEVVIDEWAGMVIALIPAGLNPLYWLIAFALFRLFDAVKVGPVGWCDRNIKGGKGVMIDDIVAGLLAATVLCVIRYFFK